MESFNYTGKASKIFLKKKCKYNPKTPKIYGLNFIGSFLEVTVHFSFIIAFLPVLAVIIR